MALHDIPNASHTTEEESAHPDSPANARLVGDVNSTEARPEGSSNSAHGMNNHATDQQSMPANKSPAVALASASEPKEASLPSMQSPASTLADTLSLLSLSTPAAVSYKASHLKPEEVLANGKAEVPDVKTEEPDSGSEPASAAPPIHAKAGDLAVGLVYDKIMEEHRGPPSHVERPQRTATLVQKLMDTKLAARCWTLPPRQARDDELMLAHTESHVRHIDGPPKGDEWLIGDNYYSSMTPIAARMAAGCTVQATEAVCSGAVQRAFAVVRPPGHHAECARAMGFCFYNNVAVAALAARQRGARRVLVLDWDVHHGNGIEEILYERPDIMYISLHRGKGFYPGTGDIDDLGKDAGRGFNLNIPFPRGGFNDADYIAAFDLVVEPVMRSFAPDLIIVSAGFDAVQGDPLGGMNLTPQVYGHMAHRLANIAADGKLVLALEGGYNLRMTAECGAECVKVLLGEKLPPLETHGGAWRPAKDTEGLLAAVAAVNAPYWPVLEPLATATGFRKAWEDYLLGKQAEASLQLRRSPRAKPSL